MQQHEDYIFRYSLRVAAKAAVFYGFSFPLLSILQLLPSSGDTSHLP